MNILLMSKTEQTIYYIVYSLQQVLYKKKYKYININSDKKKLFKSYCIETKKNYLLIFKNIINV